MEDMSSVAPSTASKAAGFGGKAPDSPHGDAPSGAQHTGAGAGRSRRPFHAVLAVSKETFSRWQEDQAARLAASLALYALLSLSPLLIIVVSVAGIVFGAAAAREQIGDQIASIVGPSAGKAIESLIAHAHAPRTGIVSSVVGLVILLVGASGVFGELQSALNLIWRVKPKPGRGIRGVILDRFFSFSMVMGVAFLLLVSLVLSAALAAITGYLEHLIAFPMLWYCVNWVVGLALSTLLFAITFKVVPDVNIGWREIRVGGFATALAFSIGKTILAWYVGRSATTSPFGAAGSLVALVVWVYYSAQILFLGAEFARAYAIYSGYRVEPAPNAISLTPEEAHDQTPGNAPRQKVS